MAEGEDYETTGQPPRIEEWFKLDGELQEGFNVCLKGKGIPMSESTGEAIIFWGKADRPRKKYILQSLELATNQNPHIGFLLCADVIEGKLVALFSFYKPKEDSPEEYIRQRSRILEIANDFLRTCDQAPLPENSSL